QVPGVHAGAGSLDRHPLSDRAAESLGVQSSRTSAVGFSRRDQDVRRDGLAADLCGTQRLGSRTRVQFVDPFSEAVVVHETTAVDACSQTRNATDEVTAA